MGDKKIQTGPNDAIVRAEQAVKESEANYNKAGFEANKVNAANQDKAAHGDAAAKQAIDEAQKKREAAQQALKEAQARLNNLKSGKQTQEKTPAAKQEKVKTQEPAKTKEPKKLPQPVPAPAQQPAKDGERVSDSFFSHKSNWFDQLGDSLHSESMRVLVEVPVCRPTPKPQATVDPKKAAKPQAAVDPKKTKEGPPPQPSSLESSLDFYCGKR